MYIYTHTCYKNQKHFCTRMSIYTYAHSCFPPVMLEDTDTVCPCRNSTYNIKIFLFIKFALEGTRDISEMTDYRTAAGNVPYKSF